jgi:hypothetical protein
MRRLILLPVLAGAFLAMGCTSPEIQPVAGDVYVISASASRYSTGKREDLIRQADAYAESRGKVAVAVPQSGSLPGIDRGGVVEYRFRLVDKGGAETQAAATPPRLEAAGPKVEKPAPVDQPAKAIKAAEQPPKDAKPVPQPEKVSDLYADLIKLDELRKRGILTEEEFQAQKKKLLEGTQK